MLAVPSECSFISPLSTRDVLGKTTTLWTSRPYLGIETVTELSILADTALFEVATSLYSVFWFARWGAALTTDAML